MFLIYLGVFSMPKKKYNYVVIFLLIILFLLVSLSSLYKSASYDEFGHLSRSVLYVQKGGKKLRTMAYDYKYDSKPDPKPEH